MKGFLVTVLVLLMGAALVACFMVSDVSIIGDEVIIEHYVSSEFEDVAYFEIDKNLEVGGANFYKLNVVYNDGSSDMDIVTMDKMIEVYNGDTLVNKLKSNLNYYVI